MLVILEINSKTISLFLDTLMSFHYITRIFSITLIRNANHDKKEKNMIQFLLEMRKNKEKDENLQVKMCFWMKIRTRSTRNTI